MKDLFHRTIHYLRISITDHCNLRCCYCNPGKIKERLQREDVLSFEEIEAISFIFIQMGVTKIRLTGGEPLMRRGIISLVKNLSRIDGLKELAMTTNGILLPLYASDLKQNGIHRINIGLHTLNPEKYGRNTSGGDIHKVWEGIKEALRVGMNPIKLNVVLMKGVNEEEIPDFIELTREEDFHVRFIELMPVGDPFFSNRHYISNDVVWEKFPDLQPVSDNESGSSTVYYNKPGFKGKIGLISPISHKFCQDCNRLRLTVDGKLRVCLHSPEEIDLINPFRRGEDIRPLIARAILSKPSGHNIENGIHLEENMIQIGG